VECLRRWGRRDRGLAASGRPVLKDTGRIATANTSVGGTLGMGVAQLTGGDVVRPGLRWLLTTTVPHNLAAEMARVRDPGGFATLAALTTTGSSGYDTSRAAVAWIAAVGAAKGGTVADITVGDSLELSGGQQPAVRRLGRGKGPVLLSASARDGHLPAWRSAHRADVQPEHTRPAHRRAADRPLRHRLPSRP